MKESLAAVLAGLQSLGHDDSREMPVDRLGALAYAQAERAAGNSALASLGVDLITVKFANRAASREPAAIKLAAVLAWSQNRLRLTAGECMKVSRWAISEWLDQSCIECRGVKESPVHEDLEGNQPMRTCPACGGSGLRIWSDTDRLEGLGGDFGKPLDIAHKFIGAAEAEAVRGAMRMLERWGK